jgi:hypothetical protein
MIDVEFTVAAGRFALPHSGDAQAFPSPRSDR